MEKALEVQGIWAAMMTPYEESGEVSEKALEAFLEFFMEKKVDGIFAVSNVGEFAALSIKERQRIIEICVSLGKNKLKICPGVTDLNLCDALKLAEFSAKQGADGVVLSSPYYYPYGDAYVEDYLRTFLNECPLPIIFYHSPRFANPIREEFLMELLANPKIAAVKESSGDALFFLSLLERIKSERVEVSVMLGWEELLLTGLVHGAAGCITSCGGIVPEILRAVYDNYQEGNLQKALDSQQSILRITRKLSAEGFPYGYKMGMAARIPQRILRSPKMQRQEEMLQEKSREIEAFLAQELELLFT